MTCCGISSRRIPNRERNEAAALGLSRLTLNLKPFIRDDYKPPHGIQELMLDLGKKNCRLQFGHVITISALLLTLSPVAPSFGRDPDKVGTPGGETSPAQGYAQPGPQPPCGREPIPPYPGVDAAPAVKSWSESDLGRNWMPPACTGWTTVGFTTLVTTEARFRYVSGEEGLLRNIGAISKLRGMRYWSTTHRRWQTLVVDAFALSDSQPGHRRDDFTPAEISQGKTIDFEQVDNLSGKATYQMHILEASPDRIVFEVENVTTIRYLFVPIFHPDEMQSIYFLDRESNDIWCYYSIVRMGIGANHLIAKNEASSINRAVAFYRHLAGIPTDQEPPASP